MLSVRWIKCTRRASLPLEAVDLSNVGTIGVYVIWHDGSPQRVVKIGQGDIGERAIARPVGQKDSRLSIARHTVCYVGNGPGRADGWCRALSGELLQAVRLRKNYLAQDCARMRS